MNTKPLSRVLMTLVAVMLACNAPFVQPQSGGGGGLETVAQPQALLAPDQYADSARALAEAIAQLNQVQEQTLEHLRGTPSPEEVDADLVQTAAAAMTVAQLAEQLAASTASQAGGGEQATEAAMPYVTAAQLGYLTVIETQNMREEYKSGGASAEQVSNMIGETGGMLWSGDHFNVGSTPAPFADARANPSSVPAPMPLPADGTQSVSDQLEQTSGKDTDLSAWSSSSSGTRTIRIVVPAPRSIAAASGLDPSQLSQMRTPEGQGNADVVRTAAAAKLVGLGAVRTVGAGSLLFSIVQPAFQSSGYIIEITVPEALVFQSQFGDMLPYFPEGQSGVTAAATEGGPLVSKVAIVNGQPQVEPPLEVNTDQPVVTLEITEVNPTGAQGATRPAQVIFTWGSDFPTFTVVCFTGSGASASTTASGASGEGSVLLEFSAQRDTAVCEAKAADLATTLGQSQIIALPGASGALAGTFSLLQSDDGCNFSAAPSTGGTIEFVVDYDAGTASGSFNGTGNGVRTALECTGNFADLTWNQSYSGTFSGTVDSLGTLNMTGTISGSGTGVWSNCVDQNSQPFDCPAENSGAYQYPITVSGMLPPDSGSGSGTIAVSTINLPTNGTWTVP